MDADCAGFASTTRSRNIRNSARRRYVMKNGELFEGETLDAVWPVAQPLPPEWWWNDGPPPR